MIKRTAAFLLLTVLTSHSLSAGQEPAPIGPETFKARRQALLDSLGDGMAVLYSSGDYEETGYRADGHFWYLTGIVDPGAVLVLAPDHRYEQVLLLKPRDPDAERWSGYRPAVTDSLEKVWRFDLISRPDYLNGSVVSRMKKSPVLHLISALKSPSQDVPPDLEFYNKVTARVPGVEIENSSRFIEQMRMIKSDAEIAAIEKAVAITHAGITDLLAAVEPGVIEYQLDAVLESSFKRHGAQHMAFPPIIGSGSRSAILHYEKRDQQLKGGQLLLLDVGAEWDHYCADISRTVPVDGRFTPRQAEIYDLVLKAQNEAIAAVKPGATVYEVHQAALRIFRDAGYIDYFMHSISHHLGIDVHDRADYNLELSPGMVITVEPGIYIDEEEIGVRIEDDVLVTEDGHRILSSGIPRARAAVEAWMAQARK